MTTNTDAVQSLTNKQIEAGWMQTFSIGNPYCPCDLKSFTKAVRWAEFALLSASKPAAMQGEAEAGEAVALNEAELLPCPFCGDEAEHIHAYDFEEVVRCSNECCLVRPSVRCELPQECTELWNTRASVTELDTTDYEAIEREHLGDSEKRTGIYAPQPSQPAQSAVALGLEWVAGLIERLERHSDDDRNTAFSRSTMGEILDALKRSQLVAAPAQSAVQDEREALAAALEAGRYTHASSNTEKHRAFKDGWKQAMEYARAALVQPLEAAKVRIATLEQTLREIAMADTIAWEAPGEFEVWAKGKAKTAMGDKK